MGDDCLVLHPIPQHFGTPPQSLLTGITRQGIEVKGLPNPMPPSRTGAYRIDAANSEVRRPLLSRRIFAEPRLSPPGIRFTFGIW